jgi:hypothetical protein
VAFLKVSQGVLPGVFAPLPDILFITANRVCSGPEIFFRKSASIVLILKKRGADEY